MSTKLDTLQAAVLSVKLAQLDRWNAARVALATAVVAGWNVGAAFVVGLIASALLRVLVRRHSDQSMR